MKLARLVAVGSLGVVLGGCASGVVGTWKGRGSAETAPFSFGSVSFVGDHTFTAEARYSGNVRVQSGTWSTDNDELTLKAGDTERRYTYTLKDGEMVVTDPKTGHSITLDRMAK